VDDLVNSV